MKTLIFPIEFRNNSLFIVELIQIQASIVKASAQRSRFFSAIFFSVISWKMRTHKYCTSITSIIKNQIYFEICTNNEGVFRFMKMNDYLRLIARKCSKHFHLSLFQLSSNPTNDTHNINRNIYIYMESRKLLKICWFGFTLLVGCLCGSGAV